ncbi:uncharacterized protein LOC116020180 [Ipomoea triloba]|uniref:uncharacterized protein LOC116020180 n=1 Tax=Ipomoea triloba TaxID=35885 RepID=UPI00125D5A3B|nr:uncharacterized protein LOC116020180 [Ipomoea triloba]
MADSSMVVLSLGPVRAVFSVVADSVVRVEIMVAAMAGGIRDASCVVATNHATTDIAALSTSEECTGGDTLRVGDVYVDDILVMGNDPKLVNDLLSKLSTAFKIRDLGEPGFFLGIEMVKSGNAIILSQQRYVTDILKRAGMAECKPLATPISTTKVFSSIFNADPNDDPTQFRSLAGTLQYHTITRRDLYFAVNQLCQRSFMPFSDFDWVGCPDDRKSTSSNVVFLGTNLVSWVCKKQRTVARSSKDAEYKALADVCAEVTWIMSLLREIKIPDIHVPRL